ncbi:MAG: hypothetical protein AVDCRST_MAG17-1101, partial [uncultured Solirubrobacterales bacterium]
APQTADAPAWAGGGPAARTLDDAGPRPAAAQRHPGRGRRPRRARRADRPRRPHRGRFGRRSRARARLTPADRRESKGPAGSRSSHPALDPLDRDARGGPGRERVVLRRHRGPRVRRGGREGGRGGPRGLRSRGRAHAARPSRLDGRRRVRAPPRRRGRGGVQGDPGQPRHHRRAVRTARDQRHVLVPPEQPRRPERRALDPRGRGLRPRPRALPPVHGQPRGRPRPRAEPPGVPRRGPPGADHGAADQGRRPVRAESVATGFGTL